MKSHKLRRLAQLLTLFITVFAVGCANNETTDANLARTAGQTQALSARDNQAYLAALAQLAGGKPEKAQDDLRRLAKARPDYLGVWINLATAFYKNDRLDEAMDALSRAEELSPEAAEIYNLSGLIAVDRGDYKAAEQHYLTALTLDNEYSDAHYNIALLYDVFYQDLAKAVSHYNRYLALTGSEDATTVSWVKQLTLSLEREAGR